MEDSKGILCIIRAFRSLLDQSIEHTPRVFASDSSTRPNCWTVPDRDGSHETTWVTMD